MARTPAPFRQADVTRAVRGVTAAGVVVGRVEVDREGRIVIHTTDSAAIAADVPASDFDRWMAGRGPRAS